MHPMKKFLCILTLALLALAGRAALPQPDLIAQIHFAGGDKVAADKNYPAFANEFSSAEARALRKQIADKLAPWLAKNLNASVPEGAAKLRPLLDDLQSAEWFFEAHTAADGQPNAALAIKLTAARAELWQTALKAFLPAATCQQSGGWLVFNSSVGAQKLGDGLVQKISSPQTNWASVDVNWLRLAPWLPAVKALQLPETALQVSADATNLLVTGKCFFPENLSLKADAWRFPTNTIHQPFNSFTAVRGLAGWLKTQAWAQPFVVTPVQNQAFFWAMNGMPFQSYGAVPVANAAQALGELSPKLQTLVAERNAHDGFMSPLTLTATESELTLIGGPMLAPYVKPVKEASGEFLLFGGFPNPPRGKPAPPELFARLAKPELLYYHWEITSERFTNQHQFNQLALLLTRHKQLDGDGVPYKWVAKFAPHLGSTATEITQTAPDQLTFKRRAPGGLTAIELLALANWFDAPNFPGLNLQLPPPSERMKQLRARQQQQAAPRVLSFPAPPQAPAPPR